MVGNEITRTERSGLVAMEPELAIEASLYRYDGDPLIFDADFERLQVFFESQGMPMPFSAHAPARDDGGEVSVEKPLAEIVRAELAATLHLGDSPSIDPGTSLIDLGVDSLLALDLRKRLRRTVGQFGSGVPHARRHHRDRTDRGVARRLDRRAPGAAVIRARRRSPTVRTTQRSRC